MGRILDLIVSVPDHCLSFYLETVFLNMCVNHFEAEIRRVNSVSGEKCMILR